MVICYTSSESSIQNALEEGQAKIETRVVALIKNTRLL